MELITVPEAADILRTSRWSVRRLIEKGALVPAARTGTNARMVLLDREHVEQYARTAPPLRRATKKVSA